MTINAFIVNRNLLTTLKNTVSFLSQKSNINIIILDQGSTYEPLIKYYEEDSKLRIIPFPHNEGPYCVWSQAVKDYHNDQPFILCDSDCTYDNIPEDWLDKMLYALNRVDGRKIGFSLEINDLPDSTIGSKAKNHEIKYWNELHEFGYVANIDTTFAMYKPNSPFFYDGIRLPRPYTMRHELWYLDLDNINEEWSYYLNNASHFSTWGSATKELL